MSAEQNGADQVRRFYDEGRPVWAEHADANSINAFGQPTAEMRRLTMDAALVQAALAQREAMQDLALSNRELAAAMENVAAEHRARRGA